MSSVIEESSPFLQARSEQVTLLKEQILVASGRQDGQLLSSVPVSLCTCFVSLPATVWINVRTHFQMPKCWSGTFKILVNARPGADQVLSA